MPHSTDDGDDEVVIISETVTSKVRWIHFGRGCSLCSLCRRSLCSLYSLCYTPLPPAAHYTPLLYLLQRKRELDFEIRPTPLNPRDPAIIALKEEFVKHPGHGWENLVHWPIVTRFLGPNPERWSEEVQGELFDKAILVASELHMDRSHFFAFLHYVTCVVIPEYPCILVTTTPGYEKCFFRTAIQAYNATLLPAYERFLLEHRGFIAQGFQCRGALFWSSEGQEVGGGCFEYIPTIYPFWIMDPVMDALRDEFQARLRIGRGLFYSAFSLAFLLKMERAQFSSFLDCVMSVPIPSNPWLTGALFEKWFLRKAIQAYDATLLLDPHLEIYFSG